MAGIHRPRKIRTVEHLLSALEAKGIDNCRIQIQSLDSEDTEVEVPIFDGSANAWVEAIEQVGRKEALDRCGNNVEKLAPYLSEPFYVSRNDSFMVSFPASKVHISCGIDFPKVNSFVLWEIGKQFKSLSFLTFNRLGCGGFAALLMYHDSG
ncbi:hypothetical protein GOBAR_DD08593 [Gossypium barbadense]|nr:hypothetical protein GOBAR_DD08593 [Gossypium barbadense]